MIRFTIAIFFISALLYFVVQYGVSHAWFAAPSFQYEIVGFLALATLAFYIYLLKRISKKPEDFVSAFILTLVLRFLLFAGFMMTLIFIDKAGANSNALFFMVVYVIFTVTEVAFLYRKVMSVKSAK